MLLSKNNKPTSKEIRLALDIVTQCHPSCKKTNDKTKAELVIDMFNFDVSPERIMRVTSFKNILFKKIIIGIKPIPNSKKYKTLIKKVRK